MSVDAKPGESCRNDHWSNRFTCPNCLNDLEVNGVRSDKPQLTTCECGALLRLEVEMIPSCLCIIADPDEQEDEE